MNYEPHSTAYRIVCDTLHRHGIEPTLDQVAAALNELPIAPITRLAILMCRHDDDVLRREWRAHQLSRNPFV